MSIHNEGVIILISSSAMKGMIKNKNVFIDPYFILYTWLPTRFLQGN
jgi:hypothetical protein